MRKYGFFKPRGGGHSKLGTMWWTGQTAGIPEEGGTCESATLECAKYCYAKRGNFNYPSVKAGYAKMTSGVRDELQRVFADFRNQLNNAKKPPSVIRFNESGDFVSFQHFMQVVYLGVDYPQVEMYAYTKCTKYLDEYFACLGEQLPDNLHILISDSKSLARYANKRNINAFVVDQRGKEAPTGVLRCPGYTAKGIKTNIKCTECGICWTTSNKEIHCHEH